MRLCASDGIAEDISAAFDPTRLPRRCQHRRMRCAFERIDNDGRLFHYGRRRLFDGRSFEHRGLFRLNFLF
jgi:hypothetical protein